ncbi:MAG: anthranilate synthase component II [Gemmatimonadota bacterium]
MILLLDNYDSFVFNLARYLEELGEEVEVVRNDGIDLPGIRRLAPTHLVISPGPGTPRDAGVSLQAIRMLGGQLPILGVCLGHQCIGEAYGARVVRARRPMHGKLSLVEHSGEGLFAGLPRPLEATRYHSLLVDRGSISPPLRISARTAAGEEVMGLEHAEHPVWGVQFHPEAILTRGGHVLLANFLALGRGLAPPGVAGAVQPELTPGAGAHSAGDGSPRR